MIEFFFQIHDGTLVDQQFDACFQPTQHLQRDGVRTQSLLMGTFVIAQQSGGIDGILRGSVGAKRPKYGVVVDGGGNSTDAGRPRQCM
jgi:hypothetical protein